jgi:hypothetical protein
MYSAVFFGMTVLPSPPRLTTVVVAAESAVGTAVEQVAVGVRLLGHVLDRLGRGHLQNLNRAALGRLLDLDPSHLLAGRLALVVEFVGDPGARLQHRPNRLRVERLVLERRVGQVALDLLLRVERLPILRGLLGLLGASPALVLELLLIVFF